MPSRIKFGFDVSERGPRFKLNGPGSLMKQALKGGSTKGNGIDISPKSLFTRHASKDRSEEIWYLKDLTLGRMHPKSRNAAVHRANAILSTTVRLGSVGGGGEAPQPPHFIRYGNTEGGFRLDALIGNLGSDREAVADAVVAGVSQLAASLDIYPHLERKREEYDARFRSDLTWDGTAGVLRLGHTARLLIEPLTSSSEVLRVRSVDMPSGEKALVAMVATTALAHADMLVSA